MIYHVEVVGLQATRTDFTTNIFEDAARRRRDLARRGYIAQVVNSIGRLVVDALGEERR